jgi:ABC-type branched-subunit amino acid transport system ATPase component
MIDGMIHRNMAVTSRMLIGAWFRDISSLPGWLWFHHFPQVDAHAHPGNAGKNTGKHRKILAIGASLLNEPSPP